MKKIVSKILCTVLILTLAFQFSSCIPYSDDYVPEENLKITYGRELIAHEYSKHVYVIIRYDQDGEYADTLNIKCNSTKGWGNSQVILNSYFDKVAYYEGQILIYTNNLYYMFDIDRYVSGTDTEKPYTCEELHEYTKEEFIKLYPEHESFDWYGH